MLPPMRAYSRLEWLQNEPLGELETKTRRNNKKNEQVGKYLHDNPKEQPFDTPFMLDGEFYQIIQILRTTKLQQCKVGYHNDRKFMDVEL